MDSEPLRHETSEVDFESVSDFERDVLPSLKGSYSDGPLYSIKKSHYWISLLLVFLSGMICMAALVAAQSKPGIGSHTLQSVTEDAARKSLQLETIGYLLIRHLNSAREVMSLDGRNAKYHLRRFVGTYNATSLYKGPPSPEVDREWQKYWSSEHLASISLCMKRKHF